MPEVIQLYGSIDAAYDHHILNRSIRPPDAEQKLLLRTNILKPYYIKLLVSPDTE
jgi:hypothetical protein